MKCDRGVPSLRVLGPPQVSLVDWVNQGKWQDNEKYIQGPFVRSCIGSYEIEEQSPDDEGGDVHSGNCFPERPSWIHALHYAPIFSGSETATECRLV
jgi:hypothetical protein